MLKAKQITEQDEQKQRNDCSLLMNLFKKLADANESTAEHTKSDMMRLYPQVLEWAQRGIPHAQYALSKVSIDDGNTWLEKAARSGDPDAMFEWGEALSLEGKLDESAAFLGKAMNHGGTFLRHQVQELLDSQPVLKWRMQKQLDEETQFGGSRNRLFTQCEAFENQPTIVTQADTTFQP